MLLAILYGVLFVAILRFQEKRLALLNRLPSILILLKNYHQNLGLIPIIHLKHHIDTLITISTHVALVNMEL